MLRARLTMQQLALRAAAGALGSIREVESQLERASIAQAPRRNERGIRNRLIAPRAPTHVAQPRHQHFAPEGEEPAVEREPFAVYRTIQRAPVELAALESVRMVGVG